ncbi:hsp70-like protein [Sodiomyces alkalinus F11]|uniref:Hsp70-like protein n=1 Tax=Sodiomyces alkalinus (strain CBS 110278 / VKM F-3762 / F11) TaxID=1314773 RepID=A0A3N2PW36_SODAK|nr:hsp70-like protein [Sodiomyces alkalinus F11]ROT38698.1 hsp70-like protein [Sodiomyces alkalinus F11]
MSVVGVDFGTLKTVIAVARNRGVDVITNEVSNRSTPSMVGFGPKSRYIGETAKTQEMSNLKNTVGSLKRLAGRSFNDPDTQIEQSYIFAPLVDVNGQVGAEVNYLGKKEKFTNTQLIAMYLSKIKQTAANETKLPVSDFVMSVPVWFTDIQRRVLIDASEIAGLKLLRLINDTTAAALGWGITKLDLPGPEEKPRRVAFIDVGHSNYTCSIVEFRKGELVVKATSYDRHLGGRNFDRAVVDHLQKEFKGKYKVDIMEHPRALARTLVAAEKCKKILSANQQAPVNVESLTPDVDASSMVTRQEFEAMIEPLLSRAHVPLEQALADANLTKDDIDVVEVLGGGSRVPALKERIHSFFGKTLSYTLNQDEAVARGCAFSCAILSPVFRVRDFAVQDITPYPIEFTWEKAADIPDEETSLTVFNRGNVVPSTKILTFYRKQPFDLEAKYVNPDQLPGKINPWIGRFSVKGVKADGKDDFMICKLKARVNIHGVLNVESGYYVEDQEVEEEIKDEDGDKKDPDSISGRADRFLNKLTRTFSDKAMDTDNKEEAPKRTRKVKKQVRKGDLPISSGTAALSEAAKAALLEKESAMVMEDKLVADTEEKKNELETYIYDFRNKLDDQYAEFVSDDEKAKIREKLDASEDWLYDEGDDTTKAVYIAKFDELRAMAGPIVQRHFEKVDAERRAAQERLEAERAARRAAEEARKAAEGDKGADATKDEEMTDAEAKPEVEEAGEGTK